MSKASFKAAPATSIPWRTFAVYQASGGAELSDLDVVLISSDAKVTVQESAFMLPDYFSGDDQAYPVHNLSVHLPDVRGIGEAAFKNRTFDCAAISARDCVVGENAFAWTTFNAPYDRLSAKYSYFPEEDAHEMFADAVTELNASSALADVLHVVQELSATRYAEAMNIPIESFYDGLQIQFETGNVNTYLQGCIFMYLYKYMAENVFKPAICLENVDLGEYVLGEARFSDITTFPRIAPRSMAGDKTIRLYEYNERCPYAEVDVTGYDGDPTEISIRGVNTLRLRCSRNAVPDYEGCSSVIFDYVD